MRLLSQLDQRDQVRPSQTMYDKFVLAESDKSDIDQRLVTQLMTVPPATVLRISNIININFYSFGKIMLNHNVTFRDGDER